MLQAYLNMASGFFNENDYDNALSSFDSALMVNPGYVAAIYNKALVYLRQNNADEFEKSIDLYLEKLGSGPEDEKAKQASKTALEYFRAAGSKASQEENLDEALALLTKAEKYGEDKDLFYFFADVYNKQKKFDQAMEYAQKGLRWDVMRRKAHYYIRGPHTKGKGQTSEAVLPLRLLFPCFCEASKAERITLNASNKI
jgi:tetratricopeptide (TPR) repeat protein